MVGSIIMILVQYKISKLWGLMKIPQIQIQIKIWLHAKVSPKTNRKSNLIWFDDTVIIERLLINNFK